MFEMHYPCPDEVSLDYAEHRLKRPIPYDSRYMTAHDGRKWLNCFLDVPCGKCDACRLQAAKNWANRCLMEAHYSQDNYFVTLTFDPAICPGKVDTRDLSGFMKRLRKALGSNIRFFGCGEYGEKSGRPHYHVILFNCKLDDLRLLDASKGLFVSKTIARCWPFGFHSVGAVTQESINYVARYTSKKTPGKKGFLQMSRRPGIGERYLLDHPNCVECDYLPLLVNGRVERVTPPRYFEKLHPEIDFLPLKARRLRNMAYQNSLLCFVHKLNPERLNDYLREHVMPSRLYRLEKKIV